MGYLGSQLKFLSCLCKRRNLKKHIYCWGKGLSSLHLEYTQIGVSLLAQISHLDETSQNGNKTTSKYLHDGMQCCRDIQNRTLFSLMSVEPISYCLSEETTDGWFHLDTRTQQNPSQVKHQNKRFCLNTQILPCRLPSVLLCPSISCRLFGALTIQG